MRNTEENRGERVSSEFRRDSCHPLERVLYPSSSSKKPICWWKVYECVTAFSQRHFILEVYKQYIWSESVYVCICLAVAEYAFQDFLEVVQ